MDKKVLGKGLSALIPESKKPNKRLSAHKATPGESVGAEKWIYKGKEIVYIPTKNIIPNKYQPRQVFNQKALQELISSIKQKGVIQPVLVRHVADERYELVAGERRLRAAKESGLNKIPAIVKQLPDIEAIELALIENVQREDLNPMEQATAYRRLVDEFDFTQEDVADKIGKDRSSIANILRLLNLPKKVQDCISEGLVSFAHAKLILSVKSEAMQIKLARDIVNKGLTVRQLQEKIDTKTTVSLKRPQPSKDMETINLEEKIQRALGTKARILPSKKGGKLVIEFFSHADLERILKRIGV